MVREHQYAISVTWTGAGGTGTTSYTGYSRNHVLNAEGKAEILASSDPQFHGDASRYNPEELFVASLSSCHMLWYLHLCADNNIVVLEYSDKAVGTMVEEKAMGGRFTQVKLYPKVVISDVSKIDLAISLHDRAHALCYIAASCNFPVIHKAECRAVMFEQI